MTNAIKRIALRWTHMVTTIPVLGYVYGPTAEVQEYAGAVRFGFVPALILSGYWMYAGAVFAILGAAIWLGALLLSGYGAAVLSQVVLLVARKMWLVNRGHRLKKLQSTQQ